MKKRSPLIATLILLVIAGLFTLTACDDEIMNLPYIRQNLAIQGGVSILYEASIPNPTASDMRTVTNLLHSRLDARGYTEATVVQEGTNQFRVWLLEADDPEATAIELGASAVLEFFDENGNPFIDENGNRLTGDLINSARWVSQSSHHGGTAEFLVELEFNSIGRQLFADATTANIGRPILIYLDDLLLSNPVVNTPIRDGKAIISGGMGGFTPAEANSLAILISQGSLPFALDIISITTH